MMMHETVRGARACTRSYISRRDFEKSERLVLNNVRLGLGLGFLWLITKFLHAQNVLQGFSKGKE